MKQISFLSKHLLWLLLSVSCWAQTTTTPNLGLMLPPHNYKQWDVPMNFNSSVIDQLFALGSCGVGDPTKTLFYNATVKQFGCQTVSGGGGSSAFGAITAGTNSAALIMGTGGSLGVTGSGTIYATTLLGNTWAAPAAIGSGTPSTGVFTNLSSSSFTSTTGLFTNLTVTGTCTGCGGGGGSPPFSVITAGTNTSALLVGSGGSFGVTGSGTINSTTLLGGTWAVPGTIGSTTPNSGAFTSLNSTTTGTFNNLTVTGVCTGCSGSTTAFGSITSGTSTGTLAVGTGGSLAPSGSGTITASSFLGLTAGTSGGVPYFSSGSTLASSAALTANLPVIGGGAGTAPSVGSRTGNTTQFASWTGATTASRCIDTDASGNLRITASDCNVGTVTNVAETFTGGIVSVAGSPITGSGTFALTVAGVSGGVPYFSSGSSWASSPLLTTNAMIKGGGVAGAPTSSSLIDTGSAISTTEPVTIAPTSLTATALTANNPNGSTANIIQAQVAGVNQFIVDPAGQATFQPGTATTSGASYIITPGVESSTPATGAAVFNGTTDEIYDGTQWQKGARWNVQNVFGNTNFFNQFNVSSPVQVITAVAGPTANILNVNDSTATTRVAIGCQTADTNCPGAFGIYAPIMATIGDGTHSGQEGFTAGIDPGVLTNQVSWVGPVSLTGTGYNVELPGVAPTAGQVLTIGTCTSSKCTSSYATPASGISGLTTGYIPQSTSSTAIGNSNPLLDNGITTANTLTYAGSAGFAGKAITIAPTSTTATYNTWQQPVGVTSGFFFNGLNSASSTLSSLDYQGNLVVTSCSGCGSGAVPSPQFQFPMYSASGTTSTITGNANLTANSANTKLTWAGSLGFASPVLTSTGTTNGQLVLTAQNSAAAAPPTSSFTLQAPNTISTPFGWQTPAAENGSAGIPHLGAASSHISTLTVSAIVGADMTNATVTATQLAAQYSKGQCTEVWGGTGASNALSSGDDAISNNTCYNDSGVTRTITAVKCRSDNGTNTTTVNPTFGSAGTGTTILSGALTCGNSYAYSSTGTVSNASWTTGTGIDPAMGGTLTGTSIAMLVEYTY